MVQRAASFLLLPLYTHRLSPADYGELQLLQVTLDVAAIALSAGTLTGVLRFYFKAEDEESKRRVFSTALALLVAFNALAALLLAALAPWIATQVIGRESSVQLVHLIAASFALEPLSQVPMLRLQAREQASTYSVLSVARLLLQVGFNVLFLVGFELGVAGVLLGTLCTNAAMGLALGLSQGSEIGFGVSRAMARDLLRFGLPYRATTAGTFILTFADRYFLKASHDLDEVGLYGLAYQFGFLLIYASASPFMQAWSPQRFALVSRPREERDAAYDAGFRWFSVVVIAVGLALCVLARPILSVMAAPAYAAAADLVPIVVGAYLLQAWTDVAELGIQVSERTKYATIAAWAAVVVVLIGYVGLIPRWAGLGAAIATALAFSVRLAVTWHYSQRLWPITYRLGPHARMLAFSIVAVAGVEWLHPAGTLAQLALGGAVLAGFVILLFAGRVLSADDRRLLASVLRPAQAESGRASA